MLLSLPLILPFRAPRLRLRPLILLVVVHAIIRVVWQGTTHSADQLKRAWKTPTKWKPIPVALGALVLLAVQFRHSLLGIDEPEVTKQGKDGAVLKPDGPWQVSRRVNISPFSIPPRPLRVEPSVSELLVGAEALDEWDDVCIELATCPQSCDLPRGGFFLGQP